MPSAQTNVSSERLDLSETTVDTIQIGNMTNLEEGRHWAKLTNSRERITCHPRKGLSEAPERENSNYVLRDSRKRIALHSRKGMLETLPRGRCTTHGRELPPHP